MKRLSVAVQRGNDTSVLGIVEGRDSFLFACIIFIVFYIALYTYFVFILFSSPYFLTL